MSVPDFQSFMLPVLQVLSDGIEHSLISIREQLAHMMNLSPEEIAEKLPSGTNTKFANRVHWSVVYLSKAGMLKRTGRGVVAITERGREILAEGHSKITVKILNRYPEFTEFHRGDSSSGEIKQSSPIAVEESTQTPEERLESSYKELRSSLASDILEAVKKSSPQFFENLVVTLLVAMGYGGSIEDAGRAVGKSGDEGIDGIIKEDKLGLDFVYIQAKKYTDLTVGRPAVQTFAGSLEGHRARKGVMLTTSTFSQEAYDYVKKIEKKIVLIDGKHLADLMIEHDVGVTLSKVYRLKRLDQDFFDSE
jgi:restriction system protein